MDQRIEAQESKQKRGLIPVHNAPKLQRGEHPSDITSIVHLLYVNFIFLTLTIDFPSILNSTS